MIGGSGRAAGVPQPVPAVLFATALLLGCGQRGPARDGVAVPARNTSSSSVSELLPNACVTSGPEACFDATDDNCNGIIDEGCGIDTGPVQFAIAWEAAKA
ncbi:MAG TPA: lipoprotein, partial [Polyangiaceae bacterium]